MPAGSQPVGLDPATGGGRAVMLNAAIDFDNAVDVVNAVCRALASQSGVGNGFTECRRRARESRMRYDASRRTAGAVALQVDSDTRPDTETVLDLSGLKSFDSSALSVLLELNRRFGRGERRIRTINVPAALRDLAQLYGVADLLFDAPPTT